MTYLLVLERTSGDLFQYEIAANRFTTLLRVLCSIPSIRVQYSRFGRKIKSIAFGYHVSFLVGAFRRKEWSFQ